MRLDDNASVVVTCSVGGAVGLLRLEDAMHRADRALYAAKQAGRNRTVLDGDAYAEAVDEPEELRLARTMAIAASLREDASSLHWQQVAELAARSPAGSTWRPRSWPAASWAASCTTSARSRCPRACCSSAARSTPTSGR